MELFTFGFGAGIPAGGVPTTSTWAQVLTNGNLSGGTNPTISDGDSIALIKGAFTSLVSIATQTANNTFTLPDATGTFLLSNLLGVANGIATLDAGGKVPNSQLPFALMEFLGNWQATPVGGGTPTLLNTDVGAQGNTYKVSIAGTVDFGAGPITFVVGDWVVNNGTIWEKVDNSDNQNFADVLTQGNTTGANNISVNTGQSIIYNNSSFTATLNEPTLATNIVLTLPSSTGTIALISDIPSGAGNNIYNTDGVMTGTRTITGIFDDLSFLDFNEITFEVGVFNIANTVGAVAFSVTGGGNTNVNGELYINIAGVSNQKIKLFDSNTPFDGTLQNANLTASRTWTLPDATGTIALTSDIPPAQNLASVLSAGNQTGTNNILVNASQFIAFQNSTFANNLQVTTLTANRVATLQNASGTIAYLTDIPTSIVTGTGTTNFNARWTSASTIGDGIIQDNGSVASIGTAPDISFRLKAIGSSTQQGALYGEAQSNAIINRGVQGIAGGGTAGAVAGTFTANVSSGLSIGTQNTSITACGAITNPADAQPFTSIGSSNSAGVNTLNANHVLGGYFCATVSHVNDNVGLFIETQNGGVGNAYSMLLRDGLQGAGKVLTSDANGFASWQTPASGVTVATANELNTGTNNTKFASALALEDSKYTNQSGSKTSAVASGTLNVYTATLTPAITAYASTQRFSIRFTNANTGAVTINLNGLGAKAVVKNSNIPLVLGDIVAGQIYTLAYDGVNFQLEGKLSGSTDTVQLSLGTIISSGTASSGFTLDGNEITYFINGSNPGVSKVVYLQFVIPANYISGGTFSFRLKKTATIPTLTATVYADNVLTGISAIPIQPTATGIYELKQASFVSPRTAGETINLRVDFTGANGQDIQFRTLSFEYES